MGQYQEGQRLQGSDGKVYVVHEGVPRQESAEQAGPLASPPEKPKEPKTIYRTLSPGEVAAKGLPAGQTYQESSEGKIDVISKDAAGAGSTDPKTVEGQRNIALSVLKAAGVDLEKGVDPVAKIIGDSTSGEVEAFGARVYGGITGDATSGMENIGRLKTIGNDLVLQMAGGSLGAQISNSDRDFIAARMGDIGNPDIPANQRLAAWDQVKQRLGALSGSKTAPAKEPEQNAEYDKDGNYVGLTGSVTDTGDGYAPDSPPQGEPSPPAGDDPDRSIGDYLSMGLRAAGKGVAGLGVVTDAITGRGIASAITGAPSGSELAHASGRDVADKLGLVSAVTPAERLASAGISGAAGALAFPGGGPLMMGISGLTGGVSGEAARQAGAGPLGQLAATLAGGAGGVSAMARRSARSAPDMGVVAAGERQGIPIRQPDAIPGLRGKMAQTEVTAHGGPKIQAARASDNAAIETRVGEIGGQGAPRDPYAGGQSIQGALGRQKETAKTSIGAQYARVEQMTKGAAVPPAQTLAAIDARIAELQAAGPGASSAEVTVLQGIKDDLAQTGLSVKSLQAQRKGLRTRLNKAGMDYNAEQANFTGILDTARKELHGGLDSINPGAARALARADAAYAEHRAFRDTVAKEFMGTPNAPVSAETASQRLVSMAQGKGNHDKFSAMWKVLDDAERADLAATVAASLGRKANGDFSPSTLIRSLDPKQGINPRTARMIFGEEGAEALQDLRAIATAKTATASALNNSRTGGSVERAANGLKTMLLTALGFIAGGGTGAVAGAVSRGVFARIGEERAARLLLDPKFTKWVRRAPQTTSPKAIDAYFMVLARNISANDNQAFTAALKEAATRLPGQAVAEEQVGDSRGAPPQ